MARPRSLQHAVEFAGLVIAALVCWTCNPGTLPAPETARADPTPSTTAEEAEEVEEPVVELSEADSLPPIPMFARIDEGVPGIRIPIEDPSGRSLRHFHAALRRVERGEDQARIAFYGASHVASDWFTGYIRERLQRRFGDAGHGFVLPVHPWRTYRHFGVRLESNHEDWQTHRIRSANLETGLYGFAGAAVEASEAGSFGSVETVEHNGVGGKASSFELYYLRQPGGGELDVLLDGERLERLSTAGESSEAAYQRYETEDGAHRFEIRVVGNGPVRIFGVAVERDEPGVVLDTLGINGARSRYHLKWEDSLYREHLAHRDPDLVVLAYGTNEAGDDDVPIEDYESRLRQVVGRVREVAPESSCLLIGPSDRPIREHRRSFRDRPRTMNLVEVQRRVANELGCGFFDLVAFMGGPMAMVDWVEHRPAYGSPDHIHFTRRGYLRLGEVLHDALMHGFPSTRPQAPDAEGAETDAVPSD
ncbi:MAG: GDSL-type esterase/lipase family protein [Myxococcota bacterium]